MGPDECDSELRREVAALVAEATEAERDTTSEQVLVAYGERLGPDPRMADIHDDAIEERVLLGAAEIAAMTCRWLEYLAELVIRGVWSTQGTSTPSQWLSWKVGIAPSTARQHLRVALRLRECPLVRERFAAGTLSYSKVRAITRVCEPSIEEQLLRWADAAPAAVLERIISDARRLRRVAAAPEDRSDLGLQRRWRDDGTYEVVLRVEAADGLAVEQHLDRLVELSIQDRDGQDRHGQADSAEAAHDTAGSQVARTRVAAQAVLDAIGAAVAAGPTDTSGADRHLVVMHASVADLAATSDSDSAESPDAPSPRRGALVRDGRGRVRAMSARQIRRMACTAKLDLVAHRNGSPADLGRARRDPDARLRRLLLARDRTCRFPGCAATRYVHAHHVQWWSEGGPTNLDNLVLLCRYHHSVVHDRGWSLRPAGAGRWTFHAPGEETPPRPTAVPLPGAAADAVRAAVAAHAHDLDPTALRPDDFDGSGYDHSLTVGMLDGWLSADTVAATVMAA